MNYYTKAAMAALLLGAWQVGVASGPVYYTVNGGPTMQLDQAPITDTFSGPAALTAGMCSLSCTLTVDGEVTDDGFSTTTLTVTDADSSGSLLCNFVSFNNFNWTGTVPHSAYPPPLSFNVGTVEVYSPCGDCAGSVTATYNNGPSNFSFSGVLPGMTSSDPDCSVNSTGGGLTSTSGNDYFIWH